MNKGLFQVHKLDFGGNFKRGLGGNRGVTRGYNRGIIGVSFSRLFADLKWAGSSFWFISLILAEPQKNR